MQISASGVRNLSRRSLPLIVIGMIAARQGNAQQESPFVRLWATRRLSVEVPRSWVLLDRGARYDLEASSEALDRRLFPNEPREITGTPLAANRVINGQNAAWMNIIVYPDETLTQADTARWSSRDVVSLDGLIRQGLENAIRDGGQAISRWHGTQRLTNRNGLVLFVTHYERTGANGRPSVTGRLARAFAGRDSFTLTTAYISHQDALFRTVALEMIQSLRLG